MCRNSHATTSKFKPKIRIIHMFAPEIIKTDVENFRELVQRLTGKPAGDHTKIHVEKTSGAPTREVLDQSKNLGSENGVRGFLQSLEIMKKESGETWEGDQDSSNGFGVGFGDLDDVIQDLGEFPLLPLKFSPSEIFGGMP
ncbi:hypothetical protein U1Q18_023226, partial [Sarracenia purpurea var. burkii]